MGRSAPLWPTALLSLVLIHTSGDPPLHGEFPGFLACPRGMLLEIHSMGALVNVNSVFSGCHLVDGRPPFFVGVFR